MKRFQILTLASLLLSAVILQACGGGSNYSKTPWQYNEAPRQAAQKPKDISDLNKIEASEATAVVQAPQASDQNLPPVKVAILLPLSGKHSAMGESMLNAAQMALFEIGHNSFELTPRDTQGTPSGAREAAQDAVNSGAQLVLGPLFAESVKAAKSVTRNAGVNMIAFSTDWTLADNSTFMMGFLPFDQVNRIIYYASANGFNNIGVFAPSTKYGDAVVSAYNNMSARAGVNTVASQKFSPNSASISTTMRQFAQYDQRNAGGQMAPAPYDAIFMPVGGDEARMVASFASQYDMRPNDVKRLGTGLWDDDSLASDPALSRGWFAAPSPKSRSAFERRYFQTYAVTPPRLATLAYDATALAAVLARNGLTTNGRPSFDTVSIKNPNGFAGIDGIFRFLEGGLVERGLAVLEFRNGRITVLEDAPNTFQQQAM